MAFVYALLLFCLASTAYGFSAGADPKKQNVCEDMLPQHGAPPKTDPFPYVIAPNGAKLRSGDKIKVSIYGKKKTDTFKGVLVQARNKQSQPIGHFEVYDNNVHTIKCINDEDTITHNKKPNPLSGVEFNWVAPPKYKGQVIFTVTVAKNGGEYWVKQEAAPIEVL